MSPTSTSQPLLQGRNLLIVGASAGLGRGLALAAAHNHAKVTACGRSRATLDTLMREGEGRITSWVGDATEPGAVARMLDEAEPDTVVVTAGARPQMAPLHRYSWEALCAIWNTDVRITFELLRECLLREQAPKRVVVFSSGAALHGSPLSGGYAGAKQMQRWLCGYARSEAEQLGRSLTIQCILPQLSPHTDLGAAAIEAYAKKAGVDPQQFVEKRFGTPVSPASAGVALVRLLSEDDGPAELVLSGKGLQPLGEQ